MLDLIKIVRNHLLADATITALINQRIYMAFKPVVNTQDDYPQVTLMDTDGPTDSLTNDYFPDLQVHIWTKGDERVTRANEIAKRILLRMDVSAFPGTVTDPCIYQIWKENTVSVFEDETQTFHKIITFRVVMEGYAE